MLPLSGNEADQRNVDRIVYNDNLGYAIVYYRPIKNCHEDNSSYKDKCGHRRHEVINKMTDPIDEEFQEHIARLVRERERLTAKQELEKICEKVHNLFACVERADLESRDVLNSRVRAQIKGKSADEICDILVSDVLKHTKYVYQPRDTFPHKMKLKIHKAALSKDEPRISVQQSEEPVPCVTDRVEKILQQNIQSQVHGLKYSRLLNRIQDDIKFLKRRCTEKIEFNY
jgi:hypothetical protein